MLALFLLRPPDGFSITTTTLAVVLSSFAVALLGSTDLIAKRIALGQIVIIYVAPFEQAIGPDHVKAVWHPVHVAASTAVGVVASVLALLFPYPRLACYEVTEKSKLYMEVATERLRLLVNAFYADNSACMAALTSQARYLAAESTKLLQNIKLKQASSQWERPPLRFIPLYPKEPLVRLQDIETPLKGMEVALSSTTSFPVKFSDQQHKGNLLSLRDHIILRLGQQNIMANTKQENFMARRELLDKPHLSLPAIPQNLKDFSPLLFFLFCFDLLYNGTLTTPSADGARENKVMPTTKQATVASKDEPSTKRRNSKNICCVNVSGERLVVALKCSLSLGLAVLFGVLFSNGNGYWSGLTVAITITPWRQATFKLANDRAQGTAIGSVYGVLGSVISQNLMELRFLALLLWIIFTSFLRRSQMYGHAGGVAAIISTLIILGRRHYGPPTVFAIARLNETFIGLSCSVIVELLLQPTRASTLARAQLSGSLLTLNECIESLVLSTGPVPLKEKQKKLEQQVNALRKYIDEAQMEPNFWFLPFPVACYQKLHGSLSKMMELLCFLVHGLEFLAEESHGLGAAREKIQETIRGDLEQFKIIAGSSLKCFEEVIQVKSLRKLEKELPRRSELPNDLELGNYGALSAGEEESEKVAALFLQHAVEVVEGHDVDVGEDLKSQVVLCLATFGFCIGGLLKETREIENGILELLQWENPGSHINLYGISCEIKALAA
ncbi:Para-hydroxybenzoic acid efflux pump subunit AaeB/fusaric acid resistance protein [Cocos nucifera]|uniref:Para-hydroxybenzoic acid efflux pump subunit AaeB/fusaric acid resistance protein n=1 Tax=Cocos nucifera TaxID=13894 RepID=A0A8K0MZR2_COCNU|nr:Para-hydroxybenzoic acid efflux pump subunit AaeB/fusaric acid resistance protein [Cocos nucifera]